MSLAIWTVVALLIAAPLMWRMFPSRSVVARSVVRENRTAATKVRAQEQSAVMVFRAGPGACDIAQRLDGKRRERVAAANGLPSCANGACGCRYVAMADQRKGAERRTRNDRRDAVRFDVKKTDRRNGGDRRQSSAAWSAGKFS